ncbi:efflux RND transporter permease subunit [Planctomycetota bacterium]|jgi:HAE1 family hydrophobic/amphiphilic exporter-1|nr:efflux RND transporter permease subunit [Planctomycetota bacterium]
MSLPAASVRRPVFATMVSLMVVALGAFALGRLRIDLLPEVEMPSCTIRTTYEGASPEVVERLVTQIIEEVAATVPGVEEIESTSLEGSSRVTVRFGYGVNVDAAAIDLQARVDQEVDELPDEVTRPRVQKFDIGSFPIVILGVSSKLDPVALTQLVEDQIRFRFSRIPGVAQVDPWGSFTREVRVELDPQRLNALGIPLDRVLTALREANLDRPAGQLEEGRYEVTLRAPAEFQTLDEIRDTVILERGDGAVTVGQIAVVKDTYEKLDRYVRVDGDLGLRVAIRKQSDANTVEVAKAILEEVERVNVAYPQLNVVVTSNQGDFIRRSIDNVASSVLYGSAFAILVLLFFLRSLRSTLVIAASIPISMVATFALLELGGLTLNLMTLGGLALGVGMMVDSSVVVLENIFRRRSEYGEDAVTASVAGADEVASAILASTITTLVIFLPLAFIEGVAGALFGELALVVVFSLICSLLVSLSLVPVLASRLLARPSSQGSLAAFAERGFQRLDSAYAGLLRRAVRRPLVVVALSCAALGASLFLYPLIGTEYLPPSDEGEVRVTGEMAVGTRLDLVDRQTRRMTELAMPLVPELVSSVVSVGPGWRGTVSAQGDIQMSLVPARERTRSNAEIADALRDALTGQVAGMSIRTRAPEGQFLLQRVLGSEGGVEIEVRGPDLDVLEGLAAHAARIAEETPGVTDVTVSRRAGTPQQEILVDRAKVADVGLSVRDVARVLEVGFAGARAGEFRADGNSYRILVQLEDAERRSIDEVLDMTLSTPGGDAVALRNLVDAKPSRGPLVIERKDQQRVVTVSANVAGRPEGSVARDLQAKLTTLPRPRGHAVEVAGTFEEQEKATRELVLSFLLAIALVYMVLACQYESLRDPLVVMLSVPFAAIGVLVTLHLTGTTLNIQSAIGCIVLGGVVVNNAILLVDQAGRLVQDGTPVREAVAEAGRRRLRPILMTTLTTVLALLPLAFGIGEGADAQAPLARAVVGGLVGSTLITLLLIPAAYTLVRRSEAPEPA